MVLHCCHEWVGHALLLLVGKAGDLALSQAARGVWSTSVNADNSNTKLNPTALDCCKFH